MKHKRSEKTLKLTIRNNQQTFEFYIKINQIFLIMETTQIATNFIKLKKCSENRRSGIVKYQLKLLATKIQEYLRQLMSSEPHFSRTKMGRFSLNLISK